MQIDNKKDEVTALKKKHNEKLASNNLLQKESKNKIKPSSVATKSLPPSQKEKSRAELWLIMIAIVFIFSIAYLTTKEKKAS